MDAGETVWSVDLVKYHTPAYNQNTSTTSGITGHKRALSEPSEVTSFHTGLW